MILPRRRFLHLAAGVAATTTLAQAAIPTSARGQAQPAAPATPAADSTRGVPRIHLMIGPGTLPSVGKDRMDLLRYLVSGNPKLTGEQMLEPLPEIAKVARVVVDGGNPYLQRTYDEMRKLAQRAEEVLKSPDIDGLVYVQGTNTLEETVYFLNLTCTTTSRSWSPARNVPSTD